MRICRLDGGGERTTDSTICAFFSSFPSDFFSPSSCLYGTVRSCFGFFFLLHFAFSSTSISVLILLNHG